MAHAEQSKWGLVNQIRKSSWNQLETATRRVRSLGSLVDNRSEHIRRITCLTVTVAMVHVLAAGAAAETSHDRNPDLSNTQNGLVLAPGGRIVGVAVDPKNSDKAYALADSGGVFGSIDGGQTWSGNLRGDGSVGSYGRGLGNGLNAFADIAIDPTDSQMLVLMAYDDERPLGTSLQGIWYSPNGGGDWQRAANASPPCSLLGVVSHIRFSPFTPGLVYASSACRLGQSLDHGKSWRWFSPVLTRPDAVIDGLDVGYDVGGADRVAFCARDIGVGQMGVSDSFAIPMRPFPAGTPVGLNCSVALDPTDRNRLFVATHGGSPATSALFEARPTGDGIAFTWRPLVAPSWDNGRPVFVQVHREGNGSRVYFHDSALVWSEDCASGVPCPQGSSATRPASCPLNGWACVDTWHADVTAIAFDPALPTKACPLLLASDGGIARDPVGGCFRVPSGAPGRYDSVSSNTGLHALLSFSATVSSSPSGTQRFGMSLWDNGIERSVDGGATWARIECGDGGRMAFFGSTGFAECNYVAWWDDITKPHKNLGAFMKQPGTPLLTWGGWRASGFASSGKFLVASLIPTTGQVQLWAYTGSTFSVDGNPTPKALGSFSSDSSNALAVAGADLPATPLREAYVIVGAGSHRLLCRTVGGQWTAATGLGNPRSVWASQGENGIAFAWDDGGATSPAGLYRTRNAAKCDWTLDTIATTLASDAGAFSNISRWGGSSGSAITVGLDPGRPGRVLVATRHVGVLVSDNYGATWSISHAFPEPNGGIMQFVFTDSGLAAGTLEETYATSWGRGLWSASFAPQPQPLVRVGLPDRPAILNGDSVLEKIACPETAPAPCYGSVIFRRIDPLPPKPPVHELVLARGRFRIPSGRSRVVTLRVTQVGRRLFRRIRTGDLLAETITGNRPAFSRRTIGIRR